MDTENATHRVTYKNEERLCNSENYKEVVDELIEKLGPGERPSFKALMDDSPPKEQTQAGEVSLSGRLRAQSDELTALDNGFSPKPPIYSIGTRVVEAGVKNARHAQIEHKEKPSAISVANQLVEQVLSERRQDTPALPTGQLRMDKHGQIVLPKDNIAGKGARFAMTKRAFDSVFSRFPCASGTAYLKSCPTKLRSINFNHWAVQTGEHQGDDNQTVLRLRNAEGERKEVFASVSPSYTAFDADKIGRALAKAFPEDAKGSIDYSGEKLRIEGLWLSDVAPEDYVAGEIFKAGVIVRSDDTGSGSIRVQSVLWRNLCLNLLILDKSIGIDIRIKHTGSVNALARRFQKAFQSSLSSVRPFQQAWSWASHERDQKLVERVQGTTSEDISKLPATAVLPGIFNGLLERDLVPVKGRRKEIVPKLLEMHTQDESADAYGVSRASVVNAFTRYAHQIETDPFEADEIRAGAGKLLSGRAGRDPAPLPYSPIGI